MSDESDGLEPLPGFEQLTLFDLAPYLGYDPEREARAQATAAIARVNQDFGCPLRQLRFHDGGYMKSMSAHYYDRHQLLEPNLPPDSLARWEQSRGHSLINRVVMMHDPSWPGLVERASSFILLQSYRLTGQKNS